MTTTLLLLVVVVTMVMVKPDSADMQTRHLSLHIIWFSICHCDVRMRFVGKGAEHTEHLNSVLHSMSIT